VEDVVKRHIEKTPGVVGGRARIVGHRVRVMDVVVWHEMRGYCADEIVAMFPGVTLADVYAALAYYFDHREEIAADFRRDQELTESLPALTGSKLQGKLTSATASRRG